MDMRRYTRLTNGHSKRIDYHRNAFAIWAFYYNFVRKHSALGRGKTPAMAAGVAEHQFTLRDMIFAADQMSVAA
jgi:transposase InsO family protein